MPTLILKSVKVHLPGGGIIEKTPGEVAEFKPAIATDCIAFRNKDGSIRSFFGVAIETISEVSMLEGLPGGS